MSSTIQPPRHSKDCEETVFPIPVLDSYLDLIENPRLIVETTVTRKNRS